MLKIFPLLILCTAALAIRSDAADRLDQPAIKQAVDRIIPPLMQANNIPGMAVAVAIDGKSYCFHYGVASRETRQPVMRFFPLSAATPHFATPLLVVIMW